MITKHTPGPWKYDPIQRGTLNLATGKQSEMRPDGYAITAVEPRSRASRANRRTK